MNDAVTSRKKEATLMWPTSPRPACFSIILLLYYLPAHNVQYEISTGKTVAAMKKSTGRRGFSYFCAPGDEDINDWPCRPLLCSRLFVYFRTSGGSAHV